MRRLHRAFLVPTVAALLAPSQLAAQHAVHGSTARSAVVVLAGSATFGPAPAVLPPGATLAVLEGDPTKPGLYTMRLSMPDGYTIPPHFHAVDEHVTVISGTFLVGMGEVINPAAFTTLQAGSFGMLPAGMRHYARARGQTVIQLHGTGPWGLTYVNPADAPAPPSPGTR